MRKEMAFLPLAAPPRLIIVVMLAGCGTSGDTTSALQQIFPASAYSDAPVPVSLYGGPFHPPVRVDTYSGSADVAPAPFQVSLDPLRPVTGRRSVAGIYPSWVDQGRIDAILPAGMLAGSYTVTVRDAAGNTIASPSSSVTYTSLGPDIDPPRIVFLQPPAGMTFAPKETVDVVVRVDDGAGQVSNVVWSTSAPSSSPAAPVPDPSNTCILNGIGVCQFQITADSGPDLVDGIDIRVDAADEVNNQATATRRVQVASAPIVTGLEPMEGSTVGGTTITVYGDGLVASLSQITVDGTAIASVVDEEAGSITATTEAHLPGDAMIVVSNGDSASNPKMFMFIPPPILKLIDPPSTSGDMPLVTVGVSGNNFRPATEFSWIQNGAIHAIPYVTPDNVLPQAPYEQLVSSTRARLVMLPYIELDTDGGTDAGDGGDGGTTVPVRVPIVGTVSIRAHDPVSGDSTLVDAFTFDAAP